ncbi:MAG: cupredoxin family copper-binding protein [Chloroflexi bacterium]|nr:cupredoxin family copper-binding protein [Chloroflexota bacterium]
MIVSVVRITLVALVVAVLPMTLAATTPARAATHAVEIADFAFAPATLTITVGDTVTWTNEDAVAHTATSTTGVFDSGDLEQGESYSVTFTAPGTYDYLCTPHPSMTGRVVVAAAAATPVPSTPAPASATPAPTSGAPLPDVAMEREAGINLAQILGVAFLVLGAGIAAVRVRQRR